MPSAFRYCLARSYTSPCTEYKLTEIKSSLSLGCRYLNHLSLPCLTTCVTNCDSNSVPYLDSVLYSYFSYPSILPLFILFSIFACPMPYALIDQVTLPDILEDQRGTPRCQDWSKLSELRPNSSYSSSSCFFSPIYSQSCHPFTQIAELIRVFVRPNCYRSAIPYLQNYPSHTFYSSMHFPFATFPLFRYR